MKPYSLFLLLIALGLPAGSAWAGNPVDRHESYLERARLLVEERAARVDPEDSTKGGHAIILSNLVMNQNLDWCSARLIEILKEPRGDMFWMIPVTSIAYHGRGKLNEEAMQALRNAWKTYMPQRGDTENHWIMYYTTLYLMAQFWPDLPAEEWYTGKSSEENLQEARDYIVWWIDITTTIGQGEYDCTHYIGEYLMPMFQLAAWAEDPEIRIRGQMMIDYILADFAIDTLDGIYVGAHARTDDTQVLEKHNGLSTMFAWLFFDNTPRSNTSWSLYVAANAEYYQLPEVLYKIANERDGPYLSRELKRTRERWRNSDERFGRVYKTTYVHPDYAVGSDQGGLLQPIQQHSWDLTWAVEDPRGVHNTIFSLNPHYSDLELQMYFTEYANFMAEAVNNQGKPTYTSGETFLGGSPYEQVFQEEDVIIALYNIPEGANHEHINGFFSKDLSRLEEDASGWIFVQGGDVYIAYYPLAPYEWDPLENGDRRLFSPHRRNGTILQPASKEDFSSWEAFKQAVRDRKLVINREEGPKVYYETLTGKAIQVEFGEEPTVNGQPVDFENWPLFESPYLEAEEGSKKLVMRHGQLERTLDFEALKITDQVVESPENRDRELIIHPDQPAP